MLEASQNRSKEEKELREILRSKHSKSSTAPYITRGQVRGWNGIRRVIAKYEDMHDDDE